MNQRKKIFYKDLKTQDVKMNFGDYFLSLRRIINDYDPMDLLRYGREDEYDPETASILSQLNNDLTLEQVHDLVFHDFRYWFQPLAVKKAKYRSLSVAIYNWMNQIDLKSFT
jgi:hypothetical protein